MRSQKYKRPFIIVSTIILVTMVFMLVSYVQAKPIVLNDVETKAKRDIAVAEEIIDLKHPGAWHAGGQTLYKGQAEINNNFLLVDQIKELTGNSCSIYLNDICVSTTEVESDCDIRAVNKPLPREVKSRIIGPGGYYLAEVESEGEGFQTVNKSIINDEGQAIGVLSIGVQRGLYNSIIYGLMKWIGITGLLIALVAGLNGFIAARRPVKPVCRADVAAALFPQPDQEQDTKQDDVKKYDELFEPELLPKGLNPITLKEIVLYILNNKESEVTVKDVSKAISLSTVSVRRYLDYLEERGLVDVEQEYGSVGRPLRIYKIKD